MSAAVKVRQTLFKSWLVDASDGCGCYLDPYAATLIYSALPGALDFATDHAATHTCPSWRASGERCSDICTDCGGKGWVA